MAGLGSVATAETPATQTGTLTENGNSLDEWTVLNDAFGSQTSYAFEGERSFGLRDRDLRKRVAVYEPEEMADGIRPSSFTVYWLELRESFGGGMRFVDSDGNVIGGFATDNPEWYVEHSEPDTLEQIGETATGYETWVETTVSFDWSAGTMTVTFANTAASDNRASTTVPLIEDSDIARVEVQNFASTVDEKT
ncbi:MAG: hypothetical protein ABEI99_02340, partial [Halobaculum sp.]